MAEDLPSEYDVIVIGTGMTESIVAAACSRVGKKVLHLDSKDYYGGMWASFNFDTLQKWLDECRNPDSNLPSTINYDQIKAGENVLESGNQFSTVSNIKEQWFIPEDVVVENPDKDDTNIWSQRKIKGLARKFNLDLAPKLLFSRGSLVNLLISSNIARYAEFRSVSRILTLYENKLETVPCSRADVFSAKNVSLVEKRQLMTLLQMCVDYKPDGSEFEGFKDKTFYEYLKSKDITDSILHHVLYAIAMSNEKTPCMVGVEKAQRFLGSLGTYGTTPFLWPMYGSGELPQCFCRLCAVFGGVYHLKRAADAILLNDAEEIGDRKVKGILSENQRLTADHVVVSVTDAPKNFLKDSPTTGGLSRGIFITNKSIKVAEKETLTLLNFPPGDGRDPIAVIEVGPSTHACPNGLYVVHMTCKQITDAENDLKAATDSLLLLEQSDGNYSKAAEGDVDADTKPQVLWALYFNCLETSGNDLIADVPKNVYLTSGPDLDIDFEFAVKQAKEIFSKMYADEDFLPRAPDSEEIVLEIEDEDGPSENSAEKMELDAQDATATNTE